MNEWVNERLSLQITKCILHLFNAWFAFWYAILQFLFYKKHFAIVSSTSSHVGWYRLCSDSVISLHKMHKIIIIIIINMNLNARDGEWEDNKRFISKTSMNFSVNNVRRRFKFWWKGNSLMLMWWEHWICLSCPMSLKPKTFIYGLFLEHFDVEATSKLNKRRLIFMKVLTLFPDVFDHRSEVHKFKNSFSSFPLTF